jgi:hypothetical protein
MDILKNFFIYKFNALSKPKILNISGLETHLNLPDKLIYNWLKGVKYRDLGDFETVVEDWAKSVGYKADGIYDPIV